MRGRVNVWPSTFSRTVLHARWYKLHNDVVKRKHFPRYWSFVRGSPVTGEFPTRRPVTWSFDVFFDLRLNKRLNKHSWAQASHQPIEWWKSVLTVCRCVLTNRLQGCTVSMTELTCSARGTTNHNSFLHTQCYCSPKRHHLKKAFKINITLTIWSSSNGYSRNNLQFCVTRRQHSSMYLTLFPIVCHSNYWDPLIDFLILYRPFEFSNRNNTKYTLGVQCY